MICLIALAAILIQKPAATLHAMWQIDGYASSGDDRVLFQAPLVRIRKGTCRFIWHGPPAGPRFNEVRTQYVCDLDMANGQVDVVAKLPIPARSTDTMFYNP